MPTAVDAAAAPPVVALRDVGKTFPNGTRALDEFSCRIAPGEFVSLLGASGCGKSTVLRLVSGLVNPTDGVIERGWAADQRDANPVGCVFQEPTLMPWARVWDNVYLPLRLRRVNRRRAADRVDSALERVGLSDFARAYPRELSGGMKMRVAVARATVTQPELLLLDEPFAALDEITRLRLNDDLMRLWMQQRWTCLFVTHSVYESVLLSSRIIVMTSRPGRVLTEIPVPLPYPRTEETRSDPEYLQCCRQVSAALGRALASESEINGEALTDA